MIALPTGFTNKVVVVFARCDYLVPFFAIAKINRLNEAFRYQ
jgi:hypothetical protein